MNENDMPESQLGPVTEAPLYKALMATEAMEKERQDAFAAESRKEDDSLVAAAIRGAYAKAWRSAATRIGVALSLAVVAGMLLALNNEKAGLYLIIYAPLLIPLIGWFYGAVLQSHAALSLSKLALWDRHRVTLVLRRVAGKGGAL